MPLYEYRCLSCGVRFEKIQKFSDPPVSACERCGGKVERLLSSPAIQFKGSGWYVTDYARKGMSESSASAEKPDGSSPAKAETSPTSESPKPPQASDTSGD